MSDDSSVKTDYPLRVLLVEDSQQDAELILLFLQRGGFAPAWQRVETEEEMRAAISQSHWDIILSDFSMPRFNGAKVLTVANEIAPDIPLIIVSGKVGEEQAVSLMRSGARDYIMKSNLSMLSPTIERELREAEHRRASLRLTRILDNVTGVLSPLTGQRFFDALVRIISESIEMSTVEIASVNTDGESAKIVACCHNGQLSSGEEYALHGTPCEEIIRSGTLFFECGVRDAFPEAEQLQRSDAESFTGCVLKSTGGEALGVLVAFDSKTIEYSEAIDAVLRLCSVRASAEIERIRDVGRLRASEQQMRNILQNMQDTFFRIGVDKKVQWITPSVYDLIGYEHNDVIDSDYSSYFIPKTTSINLWAALEAQAGKVTGIKVDLQRRDGSVVWVSINAQYYYEEDGKTIGGIEGVARNITQQRMAEAALRQSEELFSKAFHASPAMITLSMLDDNYEAGCFIDVNEAFLEASGYSREEVIGKSVNDLDFFVNARQREIIINLLKDKGYGRGVEAPFRSKQGEIRYGLGSIELIDIAGSHCVLTVTLDITDRKRAEEELGAHRSHLEELVKQRTVELSDAVHNLEVEIIERRNIETALVEATTRAQTASKAKSEFLANMSHELRTPLNSIIGFSELLMLEPEEVINSDSREKVTYVLDSAWHLLSLINDILDLSKIEAGKMELAITSVSTDKLLDSISSLFKEKLKKRNVTLHIDNLAQGGAVLADERKLKQILFNLVDNAIKFTPDGGRVDLRLQYSTLSEFESFCGHLDVVQSLYKEFLDISVTDTGIGISRQDCALLFTPFKQIDSSVTRKFEGSGLGLSLCREMVHLHGGHIDVLSEEGQGSCFRFMIPCGSHT